MPPLLSLYIKASRPPILAGIIAYSLFGAAGAGLFDPLKLALFLASGLLATCAVYSFNCFTDAEEDAVNNPELPRMVAENGKSFKALIALSLVGSAAAALALNVSSALVMSLVILIGLLYSLPLKGFRFKKQLVLKSASIGVGWALLAIVPFAATQTLYTAACATIFLFASLQVFIGATLRDFADVEGDRKAGVKSMPVALGVGGTKAVLYAANAFSAAVVVAAVAWFGAPPFLLALLAGWTWRQINLMFIKEAGTARWALREFNLGAGAVFAVAVLAVKILY